VFDSLERTMTLPYRLSRVLVANPAPAQPPTSVQEFVPPDRYHIINRDPGSPRPEVAENETIVIGSLLYLRQGTGPWIQTTMPQNAVAAAALTPDRRNISCMPLPPEADAPATSQAYEFHAQNQDGTSGGRIWIGGDGLPLRIEITSKLEEEGTNSWLGTFEYGTDIGPIEAPTPGP
jgi:hypothetical protein